MQSTRFLFKRLHQLAKIPQLSKLPQSAFAVHNNFSQGFKNSLYHQNFKSFSTASRVEEREHQQSEIRLFIEEFNLITKSPTFNKGIVLHTIEKYLDRSSKINEPDFQQTIVTSAEFQKFARYVSSHLRFFETADELGNIIFFLVNSSRNEHVKAGILNRLQSFDDILSISKSFLPEILGSLLDSSADKKFIDGFLEKLRKNKSSLAYDDYFTLLAIWNPIFGQSFKVGSRSEAFTKLFKAERETAFQQIDNLSAKNLTVLYELIFEEEQTEKWRDLTKKIEDRIAQDPSSLEGTDITKLVYILLKLQKDSHELWALLESEIISKINQFSPNNLVTLVGSYSTMNRGSDDLFMHIDRQLGFLHETIRASDLANAVFCFAQSEKYRKKFFFLLSEDIAQKISQFSRKELVKILWAYSTTSTLNESLYRLVMTHLTPQLPRLDQFELGLFLDCLLAVNDSKASYMSHVVPQLNQLFGDSNNYKNLNDQLVIKTLLLREKHEQDIEGLLPSITKYLLSRLEQNQEVDYLLQLGEALGENSDYLASESELRNSYIKRAGEVLKKKDQLDQDSVEELEFYQINFRGLSAN